MNKGYLSFEQVKLMLPPQLAVRCRIGRRSIYKSSNDTIIGFANSKDYGGERWWYSIFVNEWVQLGVKNVCLTLGELGIVILPIEVLSDYAKYADYNDNYADGRRFFIRVKMESGRILLYHSSQKDVDITSMFKQVV